MLTKELLINVALFLERDAKPSGVKEAYALCETHTAVMTEIKSLEEAAKGEAK